jgi:hypothetical protein
VNVPVVLNAFLLVWFIIPKDDAKPKTTLASAINRMDPVGIALFVASLVLLMVGLLSLETEPLWLLFAAFVPLAALFIVRELKAKSPFVDVRLMIDHRQLALTCARAVVTFVSFYCIFYGLPQWLEASRGLDPAATGLLMLPVFGIGVLSTISATRLGKRLKPRLLLVIGTAAMALAGTLLWLTVETDSPLWYLGIISALLGVPNGFNNMGNQLILHHSVPESGAGSASGVYRTAQYLGASLSAVIVAHAVGTDQPYGGIRNLGRCSLPTQSRCGDSEEDPWCTYDRNSSDQCSSDRFVSERHSPDLAVRPPHSPRTHPAQPRLGLPHVYVRV